MHHDLTMRLLRRFAPDLPECDVPACMAAPRRALTDRFDRFVPLGDAPEASALGLALSGDGATLRFYCVTAQHGW